MERQSLDHLLEVHRALVVKCMATPPDPIETSALSAMLHSFYTGIENLFKRIAVHLDGGVPQGEMWHSRLLDSMMVTTPGRRMVIMREVLHGYLTFRHVFRHAYAFELRWSKMAPLVLECERSWCRLKNELDEFVKLMDARYSTPEKGQR